MKVGGGVIPLFLNPIPISVLSLGPKLHVLLCGSWSGPRQSLKWQGVSVPTHSPRGLPRSISTKWLKERPQVSSEDVHYVLFFCGNLFTFGPQVPSSGKDPLALSVVIRPYQVDQTSDRWPGDSIKKTQSVYTKEIWRTINRKSMWSSFTKSHRLVPRPSSHYSLTTHL